MFLKLAKHKLFSAGLIMVLGSNVYNGTQFIYHFLTAKFLGSTALYGDLASIVSLLGLISIVQLAVSLTIIKYVASEKDENKLTGFVRWVWGKSILVGGLIMIISIIATPYIADFLHLSEKKSLYLLGPILLTLILAGTGRSVLQGLANFPAVVSTMLVEGVGKLLVTGVLLYLGYSVFGALVGFLGGVLLALVIARYLINKFFVKRSEYSPHVKPLFKYSIAAFTQGLALTSMYSTDLLLVKHFFTAEMAGIYASLAILGRVIFFGASPVTNVMFPLIAKKHSDGEKYHTILYLSIAAILGFSIIVTGFYYLFPQLPLGVLYGKNFLEGAGLLWWYAIFMSLLSLAMLMTQFYLSIGKTKSVYLFVVAAILQIILILFMHSSILVVIQVSILAAALLNLALLVYFLYQRK